MIRMIKLMIRMKRIKSLTALLMCCALLAACSGGQAPSGGQSGDSRDAAGASRTDQAAAINGDHGAALAAQGVRLPVSRPSIYVVQAGYVTGRDKKILFAGDQYGETFEVVRQPDGETVYAGRIPERVKDVLSGQSFGIADITGLDGPGTYHIRTDIVGQSYPFSIAEDTYEKLFLNILRNLSNVPLEESPDGVCDVCFGMHATMHALQCNGTLFEAAYEHLGEEEQDKQLVAQLLFMTRWLIGQQRSDGSLYGDPEATAAFCGIIEMSCDQFGRYETSVAKEYHQAAQKAWDWLEDAPQGVDVQDSVRFYAAAQLFKSEGGTRYKTIAEGFLREKGTDHASDPFVFYGVLSYVGTSKGTDRDLCTHIMKDIVDMTEDLCAVAKEDPVFGTGTRSVQGNMSQMLYLGVVNYLMPSKEYTLIIENSIQYIGGYNENGICYMGADGIWMNIQDVQGKSFEWNGIMLLALSDLLYNLDKIE